MVGNGGLGLAMVAPPVVALGFLTDLVVAQVGGSVLMTAGAYLIATSHLVEARSTRPGPARWLLAVSGASIWVPMVLAVAWASAQHSGGPALSIPDMVRIHGSLNAIGFVGCGLTARWLARRSEVERGRLRAGADAASLDPAAGVDRACPATTIDPELAVVLRRARRAGRAVRNGGWHPRTGQGGLMTLPTVAPGRLSPDRAAQLLDRARAAEPTYGPLGDTFAMDPADADLFVERVVGAGPDDFAAAVSCFRGLDSQRSVATVWPHDATATVGETVLIALAFGPVTVVAVNRIVAVMDEADRWGFAYVTLPGHAEVGEEAFVVERRSDGTVAARVVAVARVALPGGRFIQPLLVPLQRRFAHRYLDVVDDAIARNRQKGQES